ncbi:MAG TPA: B12-binding domain-containing radical SAM protein [Candidatus Cottocaccamicrobium excrementipullorum]|nr:B12-binding domain-containing radical SAM protein [Candidatus Cottocaccamicrobium excrementipullorum]
MKYLLGAINAKYIHSNLGVYSLKAYASQELSREKGKNALPELEIGEYTINHSFPEILADIYRRRPDVAALSCYIWNVDYVEKLIREIPKVLPETEIWLGGPEVSYHGAEFLRRFPQVRLIMKGEGEETFFRLIRCREDKREEALYAEALGKIPGIVYRDPENGEIQDNAMAPEMEMDRIPFPYGEKEDFAHRIFYYESSRGCPFACSYCLSSLDRKVRFRSLELVFPELQFFLDHQARQVKFVDRTFNVSPSRTIAIWQYLRDHDNGITNFHFEISADLFTEDEIKVMKTLRPGLIQLEIGVQSANPRTLQEIRRKTDLVKVEAMTAAVREGRNIHQHLDLIAGLPFEDLESFLESFDRIFAMKPDQLQLGFLKVLKGSYLEERQKDYQLIAADEPPFEVLSTKWLSYADVLELKQVEEMVEIYYNSGQFTWSMEALVKEFSRPSQLFQELGRWYEKNGLNQIGHSRLARYELLFSFVQEKFPKKEEMFRDSLTVDYYLRENKGVRPGFSRDLKPFHQSFRAFYQQEEKERRYLNNYKDFDSRQMAKMTHLEVTREGKALLFDYRSRDPLTNNGTLILVEL